MTTATLEAKTTEFDVNDVEYLRHGSKPLLARVFKPRGEGPFPALVECHGGAWCMSDRMTEHLRHEYMASHGIVSIALDFRSGNEDPYPASAQDINYAVRWAKQNARELKTRPELIGISGQSS
ncbi:MAG TPA: alpha/beta hydrolase, partial [Xanthobacteraceae bacterium]|nr:alpha/beta hydrolase [Xanthobacteraceae bacterium]